MIQLPKLRDFPTRKTYGAERTTYCKLCFYFFHCSFTKSCKCSFGCGQISSKSVGQVETHSPALKHALSKKVKLNKEVEYQSSPDKNRATSCWKFLLIVLCVYSCLSTASLAHMVLVCFPVHFFSVILPRNVKIN